MSRVPGTPVYRTSSCRWAASQWCVMYLPGNCRSFAGLGPDGVVEVGQGRSPQRSGPHGQEAAPALFPLLAPVAISPFGRSTRYCECTIVGPPPPTTTRHGPHAVDDPVAGFPQTPP